MLTVSEADPARRYCRRRRRRRTPWPEASVCTTQPSGSVTEGPQAVKGEHYAAVEVGDRGAAGGECLEDASAKGKRGTKPFDSGHREE